MKSSLKTMAVTGLLAGTLAVGSFGVTAMANGNAYETYKSSLMNTSGYTNSTINTSFEVKENNVSIFSGSNVTKTDGSNTYSTATATGTNGTFETESSTVDGIRIERKGDSYTSTQLDGDISERRDLDPSSNSAKLMNMVADLLVGDVKNQFVSNGDSISLDLSEAQVPELANVAVAAAFEQKNIQEDKADTIQSDVMTNLQISQNVRVQQLHLEAIVSDGSITNQTLILTLVGEDNAGASHTEEIEFQMNTTDIGTTTVEAINTDGKTVEAKDFHDSY